MAYDDDNGKPEITWRRRQKNKRGIRSDTDGSYTGTPADSTEQPVQDADDL